MPAAALRALLEHAIDYAGLFPPADLALEPALENHAGYVRSADQWMLGSFILPVGKFDAAAAQLAQFSADYSLQVSALGPKSVEPAKFHETLQSLTAEIERFQAAHPDVIAVTQLEMPLPPGAEPESLGELRVFWESPFAEASTTIAALAGTGAGFKLRTGGVIAEAFPSDAEIARVLVAAARQQVPLKFTAGLHHPVKHFHESVGTKMHGFLNVLGAGVLAAEHGWDEAQTAEMLADENPGSFSFDDEVFRWGEWEITTTQIIARRQFVTSLGSCSFDEPRDDLRALGLFAADSDEPIALSLMPSLRQVFAGKKKNPVFPRPLLLQDLWEAVARFSAEIRSSDFMREMLRRHEATDRQGMMGMNDCATLYALARWQRPTVVVESGGYLGMSSAFILKALADENLPEARVYSIEMDPDCPHGVLVPEEFRARFIPLRGNVKDLIKGRGLPSTIDLFLHDSSHRYRHMLWEFRAFWPRLRDRGLLVSHDVHFNAAFPEFIAGTYAHDPQGLLDPARTTHYEWGRWGYVGFAVKRQH